MGRLAVWMLGAVALVAAALAADLVGGGGTGGRPVPAAAGADPAGPVAPAALAGPGRGGPAAVGVPSAGDVAGWVGGKVFGVGSVEELVEKVLRYTLLATVGPVIELFQDILGGFNGVVFGTDPDMTYRSSAVAHLQTIARAIASGLLGLVLMAGFLNIVTGRQTGRRYGATLELLERAAGCAVLAFLLLNVRGPIPPDWTLPGLFIQANNAVVDAFKFSVFDFDALNLAEQTLTFIAVSLIFAIFMLVIAFQMLMRLALIGFLIVVAPVAMVLWALPQTKTWGDLWWELFPTTVFQQGLQVIALNLGMLFMGSLHQDAGAGGLTTLAVGIAAAIVAIKVPGLIAGRAGGAYPSDWMPLPAWIQSRGADAAGRSIQSARASWAARGWARQGTLWGGSVRVPPKVG